VLIHSSEEGRLRPEASIIPKSADDERMGFKAPAKFTGRQPLGVAINGVFPSHFADKPSPIFGKNVDPNQSEGDRTGRTLKTSSPDARIAVIGSSSFIGDFVMQLGGQFDGGPFRGNQVFITNLIDWSLEDTDLISIRSAGAFARTLEPLKPDEKTNIEIINYAVVLLALVAVLVIATTRRRMAKPMVLDAEAA
jgi:ABC-2 type transport system permease protein